MAINSKEEAFSILDKSRNGIPFEAIKYLYNLEKEEELLEKIYG